jgi:hypothetical protein
MNSNDRSELIDLERGLPTTERDVQALRALRYPRMTDPQYVRFLATLAAPDRTVLAAKRGPHGVAFSLGATSPSPERGSGCGATGTRQPHSTQ